MTSHSQLDHFRILKTLGTGYSGKVKLGQDINTGNTFALKILSNPGEPTHQLIQALQHEFEILKNVSHPSIIKMHDLRTGTYTSKKKGSTKQLTYAVIELATGGEIFDVIFHSKGFDENLSRFYFQKLMCSLQYLHQQNIAHRDLKPENLLLDSNFDLKVVDFGFAVVIDPSKPNKTRLGTEKYMAPELLYKKSYDAKKVDVFAAGVILFVFYSGHPPFNQATEHDPYYKAFVKNNEKFWDFHSKQNQKRVYSQGFKDLINSMLSLDPEKRISADEIVQSAKWVHEIVDQEDALHKMSTYSKQMRQINEQASLNKANGGANRDGAEGHLEDLYNFILPDLKYTDLTDVPTINSIGQGIIIKTENKDLLAASIVKNAQDLGGSRDEKEKEKLVIEFNSSTNGNVTVEVKFYKQSEEQFEVKVIRKSGDYFDFQRVKTLLHNAILKTCEAQNSTTD